MNAAPRYDGRRAKALESELLRRAEAVLSGDGANSEIGSVARAIIAVAARLEEEVTTRLDQAPVKQAANFYTAAGIGRDPARPAALPVAFTLVDGAEAFSAPAATQLIAAGTEPVVFETDTGVDLVPGKVAALRGLDADRDWISKPSDAVVEAALPRSTVVARRLLGGAAAGASKVQIDPSAGLKPGMLLTLGEGDDAREYVATAVDGDLVTLAPPLEGALQRDVPVREVTEFAPFAGASRNYQSHALYLGHSTLLDLPSTAKIVVNGAPLPPETEWSWWGKLSDDQPAAWQKFPSGDELAKPAGKLVKTKINGLESLWLRAKLPVPSSGHIPAQDVRLAVGGTLCGTKPDARCPMPGASVGFTAVANTIPIVPNSPFEPFGREPRLYDSFYLGSDEAFAKAGAEITLCFDLAGADLGPLVSQPDTGITFGVGTDGLLYFLQLKDSAAEPTLATVPQPTNDKGIIRFKKHSPIALDHRVGRLAVVGDDERSIYFADPQELVAGGKAAWNCVSLPAGAPITSVAIRRGDRALFALSDAGNLYQWDLGAATAKPGGPREHVRQLLSINSGNAVLLVIEDASNPEKVELLVEHERGTSPSASVDSTALPETRLSVFEDGGTYYIAGYDQPQDQKGYRLKLVAATVDDSALNVEGFDIDRTFPEALPVAFSAESSTDDGLRLPDLILATPNPTRISWEADENEDDGDDHKPKPKYIVEETSIGESSNPDRQFCRSGNYEIVQASGVGLLFRSIHEDEDEPEFFIAARAEWNRAGPDRAANPALSWEYWNGESWWALAALPDDVTDDTDNFTVSGGVFFTVPRDIVATEVAGKRAYWIRARLVGGDYGEAEVVQVRTGVFRRDTSTIRAPTIIQLKLGYCALQPKLPEIVLTEDNLGFIDQTSANEAGLEFPLFTPVAELMNPVSAAETSAVRSAAVASCDDPCPQPSEDTPGPCDAPGAYESCDSPCMPPDDYRPAPAGEPTGFVRGIMVGFDQPFFGETIPLYVDAKPTGQSTELVAEILQGGRFVRASVVSDSTFGLTESGFLTLAFPKAPDESDLLGASVHWLRLHPKSNSGPWAPVLRGIHLNAVMTHSVESHARERLGGSLAIEGQEFHLAGAPVLFGSAEDIEIRVKEPVGEEEKSDERLDTSDPQLGDDWVRWNAVDDLAEVTAAKRVFALDPNDGIVKFGDGRSGLIPPLGADVVAVRYKRVIGVNANGIAPGTQIPLLSPLAGVERVYALDYSAGGSDVETVSSALERAAAKLRHGRRILTPADLQEHARTLSPRIAQVRLDVRAGASRLIVAMRGADAQPSRADLREFADAIREVAGFGVARKGALEVVAPRLLPLAIELWLQPAHPDDFEEAAKQAKDAVLALFDPATGNHDSSGWPIGRLPDAQDLAAALAPIEVLALLTEARIERADREVPSERTLPASIAPDVLVRVEVGDIDVRRAQDMAA